MSSSPSLTRDDRLRQLQAWVATKIGSDAVLQPASSDASFRRYFRIVTGGHSVIAMDSPPEQEPVAPFIDIARRLRNAGVPVPQILAEDVGRGFLLLDDLGRRTLLDVLAADPASELVDELYRQAIDALLITQQYTSTAGLPVYNEALLLRELALFPDWYLQRHHGIEASGELALAWQRLQTELLATILAQPRVFVHRDFMPRNLMVTGSGVAVIDFQDAVLGPIGYDPICLFKDAFISWPQSRVEQWLSDYWQQARQRQLPVAADWNDFLFDCDAIGVHRHLKVIGIFARIRYRDHKPAYFEDVSRFFAYLSEVAERQPRLEALQPFLQLLRDQGAMPA